MFGIFQPLFVIGLQYSFTGFAANDQSKFPGQVVAVLDAGIHSLRSGGRVNVRGVAGEKAAARRKSADMTRVDFVRGKPLDVLDIQIEFGFRLYSRFNLS